MKPRARRITIGAAVLVGVLVSVLVVANWGTVRDHVEAWHFQLTRETRTIEHEVNETGWLRVMIHREGETVPRMAAESLRCRVIFDPRNMARWVISKPLPANLRLSGSVDLLAGDPEACRTDADMRALLEASGYRILEQRFPRRAYVVIRDDDPIEQAVAPTFTRFQPIQWDGVYPRPERSGE